LSRYELLIGGGELDPNLAALLEAARSLDVSVADARVGPSRSPTLTWDLQTGDARLDGHLLEPHGAFQRYDVFYPLQDTRPQTSARSLAWYSAVQAWLSGTPNVRMFNRNASDRATSKPLQLLCAKDVGLPIPNTVITNDFAEIDRRIAATTIAKPVAGGDFCYALDEVLPGLERRDERAAAPGILQNRLAAPEIRIYVIASQAFAFRVHSSSLDYRRKQDAELEYLVEPPAVVDGLRQLMSELGMDYGAADFKTHPATDELVFLEINSSPMFVRFDEVAGGRLCRAMVKHLVSNHAEVSATRVVA
jgi:hypothetical protein